MTERQIALKDRIGDLMEILDVILDNGIVGVEPDENDSRCYSIQGLSDALGGLAAQVRSPAENDIAEFEETFADERRHILKIIGRLAEMAASATGEDDDAKDVLAVANGD
jgi:ABC-type transporter Mla subunit MlaD